MANLLRDDVLRNAVGTFAHKRLRELDAAPLLARLIDALCDSGQHQLALTSVLRSLMRFLDQNRAVFRQRVAQFEVDIKALLTQAGLATNGQATLFELAHRRDQAVVAQLRGDA